MDNITIVDQPEAGRYELRVGTAAAGHISYRRDDELTTVTHTVVSEDYAGRGLAGQLAAFVLEDLRAHGRGLIPECTYMQAYLRRNPQELDLVPVERRTEFDLV